MRYTGSICWLFAQLLCGFVAAQPTLGDDTPTQRWLPLPIAEDSQPELRDQALLLQRLREMVVRIPADGGPELGGPQAAIPPSVGKGFDFQQLRELEATLRRIRETVGDDALDEISKLPPQWLESVMPDPDQRRQAQELLKQLRNQSPEPPASTRQPSTRPEATRPEAIPGSSVVQPSSGRQNRSAEEGNAADRNAPNANASDPLRGSPSGSLPAPTPSADRERLEALQQLLRQLSRQLPPDQSSSEQPQSEQSRTGQAQQNQSRDNQPRDRGSVSPPSSPGLATSEGATGASRNSAIRPGNARPRETTGKKPSNSDQRTSRAPGNELPSDSRRSVRPQPASRSTSDADADAENRRLANNSADEAERLGSGNSQVTRKDGSTNIASPENVSSDSASPVDASTDAEALGIPRSTIPGELLGKDDQPSTSNSLARSALPKNADDSRVSEDTRIADLRRASDLARQSRDLAEIPRLADLVRQLPELKQSINEGLASSGDRGRAGTGDSGKKNANAVPSNGPGSSLPDELRSQLGSPDSKSNRMPTAQAIEALRRRLSEQQSGGTNNSTGVSVGDVREQVERYGLGPTLQRIVDKTLKEQGADKKPSRLWDSVREMAGGRRSDSTRASSDKPTGKDAAKPGGPSEPSRNNRNWDPAGDAGRKANANTPRVTRGTPRNANTPTNNAVSNGESTLGSFWKAITTAPSGRAASASRASSGNSAETPGWSFTVGWRQITVLLVAITVCGLLIYFARLRGQLLSSSADSESVRIQEILSSGLKTRLDIVNAFHRFVLRRQHAVADWWTHKLAAQKLRSDAPHSAAAIEELTSIYEQARYLPQDFEFTPEQLEQAERAYRQCTTGSDQKFAT